GPRSPDNPITPVRLLPGRLKLATKPILMGSTQTAPEDRPASRICDGRRYGFRVRDHLAAEQSSCFHLPWHGFHKGPRHRCPIEITTAIVNQHGLAVAWQEIEEIVVVHVTSLRRLKFHSVPTSVRPLSAIAIGKHQLSTALRAGHAEWCCGERGR